MKISVNECANTLKEKDNILILTHANPDGDTLGCGYALCRALMKIGKICSVINADNIPKKYNYLFDDIVEIKFKPDYIVAVDVATVNLLGGLEEQYKVDMCIDPIQPTRNMPIYCFLRMFRRRAKLCMMWYLPSVLKLIKKLQIAFIPALLPIQDVFAMIQQLRKLTVLPPTLLKPVPITEE